MHALKYSGKIKNDIKTCSKRGYNLQLLESIIAKLMIPEPLEIENKDHDLKGKYKGFRECQISPDWLLIYRYNVEFLELSRTGRHAGLFVE